MKTIQYTTSVQFAADESFRLWVKAIPGTEFDEWQEWIDAHPQHQEHIAEATLLVRSLLVHPERMAETAKVDLWRKIQEHTVLRQKTLSLLTFTEKRLKPLYYWSAAAVLLVVVLSFSVTMFFSSKPELTFYTSFGEKQQFSLPDGSTVVLNANSELSYSHDDEQKTRLVTLKGEAYFSIVKQSHNGVPVKFSVTTNDAVIEVLGTQFNVNTRRERTQVVLNEGKVRCISCVNDKTVDLLPGEASEISENTPVITKKRVKTELYSSWKDNRFVFEETSLAEIALLLKELYNLEVTFLDPDLQTLLFTGNIPSGNLDLLITVLSESFRLTIEQSTMGLTIKKNTR